MSEPVIAMKNPLEVELDKGKYYWCACGKSSNQPFCDGSHKGTEFSPVELVVEEKKKFWLCGCKNTKNPPLCDGTHKNI